MTHASTLRSAISAPAGTLPLVVCAALLGCHPAPTVSAPQGGGKPAAASTATSTDGTEKTSFLFVQTARRATVEPARDAPGAYQVTLRDVSDDTVYFSDRPSRIAGAAPSGKFVARFPFGPDNPPNAALVMSVPGEKAERVAVVELTRPVYDDKQRTLSYLAKPIDPASRPNLKSWTARGAKGLATGDAEAVSVFIDDCPDGAVACYGGFECRGGGESGSTCCRVGCGGIGHTVGYCWSWMQLSCVPCRDYSDECNATVCNQINPLNPWCTRGACSSTRSCM